MALAKIFYVFYKHSRDTNRFLQSNSSVNRSGYFRILALACVDILLTLPLGVTIASSVIVDGIHDYLPETFQFYDGWRSVHSNWGPVAVSRSDLIESGFWNTFIFYVQNWTSIVLALAIFGLFGLTRDARTTYWRGICVVGKRFGWTPPSPKSNDLGEMQFGARPIATMSLNLGSGCVHHSPLSALKAQYVHLRSLPSFIGPVIGERSSRQELENECVCLAYPSCICANFSLPG
jgi:hypothetical protein